MTATVSSQTTDDTDDTNNTDNTDDTDTTDDDSNNEVPDAANYFAASSLSALALAAYCVLSF